MERREAVNSSCRSLAQEARRRPAICRVICRAPAAVDVGAGAAVAGPTEATEPGRAAESADATPPTTRTTGGNKFEPNETGSRGATTVGGQRHPGSKSIGSTLSKIVKGIKKALTHE